MTLKTARGTRALLALEDSAPDVLFETLPGASVPLWSDVRSNFMSVMQGHDFGSSSVDAAPSSRSSAWIRLSRSMLPSRWDARHIRSARDAVFLMSGVTTHSVEGRVRNWLAGDYVDQFSTSSAVLQWAEIDTAPAFALTRTLDPLMARASGYARLSRGKADPSSVRRLVQEFAAQLDSRITEQEIDAIAASASYAAQLAPHVESQFSRLLDRLKPRVVIMEDASYGSRSALVALMKERGIHVAEPQHGWIGPTHGAYNFGAAMRRPELLVTLPDELLTFGEYWSEGIRHPARSIAIGKPHLEAKASLAPEWTTRSREVLLVSSVAEPATTTDFALALQEALPGDWIVRFRPHPSERAVVETRYARMLADPRIVLDVNSDVYDSLSSARGVVGVASTVLFEALAMGCRVFVRGSLFSDYYTGDLFGQVVEGNDGVAALVNSLSDQHSWKAGRAPDSIWKPGAVENFRRWLEPHLA